MNRDRRYKNKLLLVLSTLLWSSISFAQEMEVPVSVQYPLFLKILTFDRNLIERTESYLTIGVVYQGKFNLSRKVKEQWVKEMHHSPIKKIQNLEIHQIEIDLDERSLSKTLQNEKINVLYITPLRGISLQSIVDVADSLDICTLSGVPRYVEAGVAVGIGLKIQKPLILINLKASKAQGMDLSSQLLKLARIIK
ncbi:MAG: YfiR family protein [Calditrichaeota bacterium]|nr:MAG: YfiR family protein [Calditrichota bacterium]